MDSRRRRWTALAVSCLLSLLLLEAASRWVVERRLHRPRIYAPDAHTSFALRPGIEETHTSWEFQVVYRVGADGYRLTPGGERPGGPRIALLGDSFTFGMGVEDGETVAAELARRLVADGRAATVVNAGFAAGKAPDDALAFLASPRGRRLAADRVALLVFVGNDFLDLEEHVWREVDAAGRPLVVRSPTDFANRLGGRGPVPRHLASPLARRLGTVRLAGRAWFAAVELPRYAEEKAERRRRLARRAGDRLPARFRTVLEGFRDRTAAGHERLVVGLVPSRAQAAGEADPDHDRLLAAAERWLDAASVPRVTFDRAAGFSAADHYPRDGHWRPSGHRRAADLLAPLLAGSNPGAGPRAPGSAAP